MGKLNTSKCSGVLHRKQHKRLNCAYSQSSFALVVTGNRVKIRKFRNLLETLSGLGLLQLIHILRAGENGYCGSHI